MSKKPFLTDVKTLRRQARMHIEEGAAAGWLLRRSVLELLNDALATEIVCAMHYRRHYSMVHGLCSESVADGLLVHASEEQRHANQIAERIVQLGGDPDVARQGLTSRNRSEYVEGDSLTDMFKEELIAERIAIDSYRDMILYLGEHDPKTSRMLREILAAEEEHTDELENLLEDLSAELTEPRRSPKHSRRDEGSLTREPCILASNGAATVGD